MQHRLERIDINEYHVMLNDQKDFRSVMAQLGRLSGFGVQMVCHGDLAAA
ncbi:DNA helicase, ATP-dependent, RecQ type [Penicillium roqueforti FM164]|uniref:DNA helicase, ATP-dependent, RecQ type n=1 Tax=Penicillium roqueforti (strain FM164) TaxID=1365484 RepID=W6QW72_PENRF|nr:DNA helicase, ATP-dependent, RecQ type [Penicillium roqueforti FM164]